jgi:DNA replication regulator DPB11
MGGRHILDLTSEVTHLICGELNTPKYVYVAKYRTDVKVVKLSWVEEIYKQWMQGDDVEPRDFEVEHRFPVFHGLFISLTGITDGEHFFNLFV